jgi:hypothetical protein
MKERTTFNIKNLWDKTPRWASVSLTLWSVFYGVYLMCITNDILHLAPMLEHKINGIYGIGNLLFLAVGGKKMDNLSELSESDNLPQEKQG